MSDSASNSEQTPTKTCLDCQQTKPIDEFSPSPKGVLGRNSYCKICMRERSKASYRKRRAAAGRTVKEGRVVPVGQRWCPDCQMLRPLEDFPRNRSGRGGRGAYCKPCHNARGQASRQRLYGGGREYHLRARYGIGQVDYDRMLAAQNSLCAGCHKVPPAHVDHDHATGEVRGLLCFNCNQALGNLRDDLQIMDSLGAYLATARGGYAPVRAYLPPPAVTIEYVPTVRHGRWS
ncbi:MAG TPA: endonuclease VII domain-containing protein [Mycobacteriales bacterium]|nr:endonuclease VII domain-containing protein [Mycobacteriales bacterium]